MANKIASDRYGSVVTGPLGLVKSNIFVKSKKGYFRL